MVYLIAMLEVNVLFSTLNSMIPATFREDSIATHHVVSMTLMVFAIEGVFLVMLKERTLLYAEIFWLFTIIPCGLSVGILSAIFMPKVCMTRGYWLELLHL